MDFADLGALARHAGVVAAKMDLALNAGLKTAAKIVRRRVRSKFGHYQQGEGPFPTWAPLTDATMAEREREGYPADQPLLRTGTLRDSYELDSGHMWAGVGSSLPQAEGHELGIPSRGVPARSTLGISFVESERDAFDGLVLEVGAAINLGGKYFSLSADTEHLEPTEAP